MNKTGIVILAAGASSRMGKPKQNLLFNNKSLLQQTIDEVLKLDCSLCVVLGASSQQIRLRLKDPGMNLVFNKDWQSGMASSIKAGVKQVITENPAIQSVIILLCDQPFVDAALLKSMIAAASQSQKNIIACSYQEETGVPVLFKKRYFEELLKLTGKEGAKSILKINKDDVHSVPFDKGMIDIDTPEDYRKLLENNSPNQADFN